MKMTTTKSLLLFTLTLITLSGCGKTPPANEPVKMPPANEPVKTLPAEVTPAPAAPAVAPAPVAPAPVTPVPAPVAPAPVAATGQMVPLALKLPGYKLDGTPHPPEGEENMEKEKSKTYRRPAFYVPAGTVNLALNTEVVASENPDSGMLEMITDGDAEAVGDNVVDLGFGPMWVTVDLGKQCEIFAILMWHQHNNLFAFRDVIVEVADDRDFITNRKTLFNNDHDGSLGKGHGKGTDKQYMESLQGKLLDAKGVKARYVRFWSNGNSYNKQTYWIEAQVFGRAVK